MELVFEDVGTEDAAQSAFLCADVITQSFRAALEAELDLRQQDGRMLPAQTGRGVGRHLDSRTRGDSISWVDFDADPLSRQLHLQLDAIRLRFNQAYFLGLLECEAHYAHYAPGTHYERHLDRFQSDSRRVLSFVIFLNSSWSEADGGAQHIRVFPKPGLGVFFLSEHIWHQVHPARVGRKTLTGWMKTR